MVNSSLDLKPFTRVQSPFPSSEHSIVSQKLIDETLTCTGATPEYYISAVGLDGSSGVIVFVDRTKDFALRAVVVHRSSFQIDGGFPPTSRFVFDLWCWCVLL
jgi:hypothetical protein